MKTNLLVSLSLLSSVISLTAANAAVSYGTVGAGYTQDFDSLSNTPKGSAAAWENDSTLEGWYWADPDGDVRSQYTVIHASGSGVANQQDYPLSIGDDDSTDRALGTQGSNVITDNAGDKFVRYGIQLTNNTGVTLNEFTLGFTAEQWRAVSSELQDHLTFDYQVFSAGSGSQIGSNSGWTDVAAFTFDAPNTSGSSQWYDGNATANREVFSGTITGVNWGAGEELWLRWNDVGGTGNAADAVDGHLRAMMGIDDVSFMAVIPEPSTWVLMLSGLLCVLSLRRRS
ncbi:PEP-CTERM sorting domain-containing protein [Kiritimatiellaeota bacterium B1221]|nr:PEP-CTERM sorting domain-containing protein [Kiritimatiellaeota bacterium B1221]